MRSTPTLACAFFVVVAAAASVLPGCSSSSPRDMNYGTDVGLDYVPLDGGSVRVHVIDAGYDIGGKDGGSDADVAANGDLAGEGAVSPVLGDTADDGADADASISQSD